MINKSLLAAIILHVNDPEILASFYCDVLGMTRQDHKNDIAVGYGGVGAALILRKSNSDFKYRHNQTDRYWKIAITLPDVDAAYTQLSQLGVNITKPYQFRDIAYMCHFSDPEGYVIELIQHTFEGKPLTAKADQKSPLGGGTQIGLITLRTSDIQTDLKICQRDLGMTLLSRQAVTDRGFDLYFLALTDECPPNPDVNALENREWLWQRSFTSLEFQHQFAGSEIRPSLVEPAEVLIERGSAGAFYYS